jgi:protein-L-isoaspartate O-methyltransferase
MNKKRSETFDEIAELYDASRPSYPSASIEDIMALTELKNSSTILEIGSGTGKATIPFAERGYSIHCLEPGKNLAKVAAENLQLFPAVTFENTTFEDWQLQEAKFDLVMSAQAIHWIPPEIVYPRAAKALKKSGSIALFWNLCTQPDREVFYRLDRVHQTYAMPRLKIAEQQRQVQERELLQSGCFTDLVIKEYDRSIRYSTEQYLNFLKTQSDYSILPPDKQQNFAEEIAEILNADGGWIDKPYTTLLLVARSL